MRRVRSNVRWACTAVVPWALAAGVLVSFTAVASNDPQAGISAAPLSTALVPPGMGLIMPSASLSARLSPAAFDPSTTGSLGTIEDGSGLLRSSAKTGADVEAAVARSRKGDPAVAMRPSLSRRGNEIHLAAVPAASQMLFGRDEAKLPPTILMQGPLVAPDWDAASALEPWTGDDPTTTRNATSVQSPAAADAGSTGAVRDGGRSGRNGGTPQVGRAVALSSTTPAPADATPLEIAGAPVSIPQIATAIRPGLSGPRLDGERPRYADLVSPDHLEREQRCLAEAVYFEARSEPEDGQAAVAQVVLNRVRSGLYPSTVCGVVYQNRHRRNACQFSFACEGKALRLTDTESWDTARRVAHDVLQGKTYLADVGGATHYHANYVRPYWARRLKKMDVIGRHIFYKLKVGQT